MKPATALAERQAAIDTGAYLRSRLGRLDDLLEDPASWVYIAHEALRAREAHPQGSPAWSVLTRLHNVAADLVRLATA